jgi:hypothetical protein
MPLLRLLSALMVATAYALPAAAQSPTAQATAVVTDLSKLTSSLETQPLSSLAQGKQADSAHRPTQSGPTQMSMLSGSKSTGPCYALRTYTLTSRDLESSTPKPSGYSTCTPAAVYAFQFVARPPAK